MHKKNKAIITAFLIKLIIFIPLALAQETKPNIAEVDVTPPAINVAIPEFLTQQRTTITGSTEPYSLVKLFVDGDINKGGQLGPDYTGAQGKVLFSNIYIGETGTKHTIKIWAQDEAGNENEVSYTITIDTQQPDLKIKDIPELITEKEFKIEGIVDEQSEISFYVLYGEEDKIAPAKVSGLKLEKAEKNLIKFSWTASSEEDFSRYIIYRNDVGPIAPIEQKTYTTFPDPNVNSNTAYTYQVAAMDKAGNIGIKSEPLTATTISGGLTDRNPPPLIDTSIVIEPKIKISADNKFDSAIRFDEDGVYRIKIGAVDKAGNKAEFIWKSLVDINPPEIKSIIPENGAFFYENYADEVAITGKTEPNANVYLYIERTPFGKMDKSFEVAGFPNEFQGLTEAKLRADCRLKIGSKELCKTNADYDTKADADGNFRFKKVDLTSTAVALDIEEVPLTELERREEEKETKTARLLFMAEDKAGHKAPALTRYNIGTCWSGNLTWEITPLTEFQSPTFLSTERLAEGTETLYFYLNFSYVGTTSARINRVYLTKACDENMRNEPRFNHSCKIMRTCSGRSVSDRTWYFACPLSPLEGMDRWLKADWEGFYKSMSNEMSFPFKATISYTENGQSKQQTNCEEVSYAVDNTRIDPKNFLPDFLLYDTVDFLQKTSESLDNIMNHVETVLEWTGIGCITFYGIKFFITVYRRFTCSMEGWKENVKGWTPPTGSTPEEQRPCPYEEKERDSLTNKELGEQCKSCDKVWKTEEKLYSLYRGLCDRVFCHTAPAKWTENKQDKDIVEVKKKETDKCGNIDAGDLGQGIRVENCREIKKGFPPLKDVSFGEFDDCFMVYKTVGDDLIRYAYKKESDNPIQGSKNVYKLKRVGSYVGGGEIVEYIYATQQTDKAYFTARDKTCKEVCGDAGYEMIEYTAGSAEGWGCITTKKCKGLNTESKKATLYGYTPDCPKIENDNDARSKLSEKDDEREGCCCIGKKTPEPEKYFTFDDTKNNQPIFTENEIVTIDGEKFPKFSYRYHKLGFTGKFVTDEGHYLYAPERYVEGRDRWGCFGQDDILLKDKKIMLDPFKSHISAMQCVCISGIYNRLKLLRNIVEAMKNCLIEIRETGTADAGVCKEIFSQYVCSMIWRFITWIRTGCIDGEQGKSLADSENQLLATFSRGTDAIVGAVGEMGEELGQEYGNTRISSFVGVGEEGVARKICLGAFGYDWEIGWREAIDVAYATPMATLVLAPTRSREYLTFNPDSGESTYEYRASWMINPGCDMDNYNVYLSCISANELNRPGTKCNDQYNCDCQGLDSEQTTLFYDGRELKSGVLEDRDYHTILTSPYRYDHLKFVLTPSREIKRELRKDCFPEGHEDGVFYFPIRDKTATDIKSCYADATTGMFRCPQGAIFWGQKGSAYFVSNEINSQDPEKLTGKIEIKEGEPLKIRSKIWKADGSDVCLKMRVTDDVGTDIESYMPVVVEGAYQYPEKTIQEATGIVGRGEDIIEPLGLDIETKGLTQEFKPGASLSFEVKFYDKDNNDKIDLCEAKDENGYLSEDIIEYEGVKNKKIKDVCKENNGKVVVDSSNTGIRAEIVSVDLGYKDSKTRKQGDEKEESRSFVIKRKPSEKRQVKKITLELVRLEGDKEIYESADDCNEADIIKYNDELQQKVYDNKIEVVAKKAEEKKEDMEEKKEEEPKPETDASRMV